MLSQRRRKILRVLARCAEAVFTATAVALTVLVGLGWLIVPLAYILYGIVAAPVWYR